MDPPPIWMDPLDPSCQLSVFLDCLLGPVSVCPLNSSKDPGKQGVHDSPQVAQLEPFE